MVLDIVENKRTLLRTMSDICPLCIQEDILSNFGMHCAADAWIGCSTFGMIIGL